VGRIVEVAAEHGIEIPVPLHLVERELLDRLREGRPHSDLPVERKGTGDASSTYCRHHLTLV
jgi:hypothetical protein